MTTTRQYPKVCDFCLGKGIVPETGEYTTSATRPCPVCHGSGTVMVTETIIDGHKIYGPGDDNYGSGIVTGKQIGRAHV